MNGNEIIYKAQNGTYIEKNKRFTQTRISHLMQTLAQTPFVGLPSDHEHTDCAIQCKEQRTRKDNERGRRTDGTDEKKELK